MASKATVPFGPRLRSKPLPRCVLSPGCSTLARCVWPPTPRFLCAAQASLLLLSSPTQGDHQLAGGSPRSCCRRQQARRGGQSRGASAHLRDALPRSKTLLLWRSHQREQQRLESQMTRHFECNTYKTLCACHTQHARTLLSGAQHSVMLRALSIRFIYFNRTCLTLQLFWTTCWLGVLMLP